jgi:hypothetical protein
LPNPTANTSPTGLYLQHRTYSSQSLKYKNDVLIRFIRFFLFVSTYTTFANSKSPNIKCFGRLSIIFVVEFRRARVVLGAVNDDVSLPANDNEPLRSPNIKSKQSNEISLKKT